MHHPNKDLQNFIESRMKKQLQEESENDAKWLRQQEDNIKKRLSISSLNETQMDNGNNVSPLNNPPTQPSTSDRTPLSPKMTLQQTSPNVSSLTSPQEAVKIPEPKVLERQNDPIYKCTTNVVRSIMTLSGGVEKSNLSEYLDLVKAVGLELRNLLGTVDQISSQFPAQTHR